MLWAKRVAACELGDCKRWTGDRSRILAPPRGVSWIVSKEMNQMQETHEYSWHYSDHLGDLSFAGITSVSIYTEELKKALRKLDSITRILSNDRSKEIVRIAKPRKHGT